MNSKPAPTLIKIHELIKNRWSPRAFDPQKPVAPEDLTTLLEAARWAASCFNDQAWRYVVCVKATHESDWQEVLSCLAEKNQRWAQHAPVLIVACAMTHFNHNDHPNRWAGYDTGAASATLSLQATALGLSVHQMGGFDADKIRTQLFVPSDATPMSVMAVGYQGECNALDDDFKTMELAERSRAPLSERFYFGRWGKPE